MSVNVQKNNLKITIIAMALFGIVFSFLLAGCLQQPATPSPSSAAPSTISNSSLCVYPNSTIGSRCCMDIDLNRICDDTETLKQNKVAPALSQGGRNCENAASWIVGKWENKTFNLNATFTDGRSYVLYQNNQMYYGAYSFSFGDFKNMDKYTVLHLAGGPKGIYYACLVGQNVQLELTDDSGQRLPLLSKKVN